MNSGIYDITNIVNNKKYVGFAFNVESRKLEHFNALKNNRHYNIHLQAAFNKYGEENFIFDVIEYCNTELLPAMEHYWATILNVHNKRYGYNIRPTHPEGTPILSDDSKKKISLAKTGVKRMKFSEEWLNNMSRAGSIKLDVYDLSRNLVFEQITSTRLSELFGISSVSVLSSKKLHHILVKKYIVVESSTDLSEELYKSFVESKRVKTFKPVIATNINSGKEIEFHSLIAFKDYLNLEFNLNIKRTQLITQALKKGCIIHKVYKVRYKL